MVQGLNLYSLTQKPSMSKKGTILSGKRSKSGFCVKSDFRWLALNQMGKNNRENKNGKIRKSRSATDEDYKKRQGFCVGTLHRISAVMGKVDSSSSKISKDPMAEARNIVEEWLKLESQKWRNTAE